METQLKQTVNSDPGALMPPGIGHAHIKPLVSEYRASDSRITSLAEQMIENRGQIELVRRNSRTLKRQDHIFHEGDESSALYVIRSGSVKSYLLSEDGKEQVLGFYFPGDVLGLDGFGEDGQGSSAVALETTSICRLPFAQMSDQGRAQACTKLISDQLVREHKMILMLTKKDADARIASFICDLSQRFKRNGYSVYAFRLSMARQDIGSYLGLAMETVSRALSRFQDCGLVDIRQRNIEILDLESLKHIAGKRASH